MSDTKIYPTTYLDLPSGDGQPMGETEGHGLEMSEFVRDVLRDHYADQTMVYVASNNFIYYDPGNVKKNVCPDCYVIKGIEKRVRDSYQSWAEGGALPSLIFELTSHSTWRADLGVKRDLYQSWGCDEYFLYDLTADKILGHLLGYRLNNGVYQEIPLSIQGRLFSEELQLELAHFQGHLRFFVPGAAQPIATRLEKSKRQQMEIESQQMEIESQRIQIEEGRKRAEKQREKAEEERKRAEETEEKRAKEQILREKAELEIERLRAEMAKLREQSQED